MPNTGPGRRIDCSRAGDGVHTGRMSHENLLDGPAPTLLPVDGPDADARAALTSGSSPREAVPAAPASSLLWALLAEGALSDEGDPVAAYAYARTGYHRGLDALRRAGWHGRGPIPVDARPQPGLPAGAARARGGRRGHRRVRGGRALREVPRRQRHVGRRGGRAALRHDHLLTVRYPLGGTGSLPPGAGSPRSPGTHVRTVGRVEVVI